MPVRCTLTVHMQTPHATCPARRGALPRACRADVESLSTSAIHTPHELCTRACAHAIHISTLRAVFRYGAAAGRRTGSSKRMHTPRRLLRALASESALAPAARRRSARHPEPAFPMCIHLACRCPCIVRCRAAHEPPVSWRPPPRRCTGPVSQRRVPSTQPLPVATTGTADARDTPTRRAPFDEPRCDEAQTRSSRG